MMSAISLMSRGKIVRGFEHRGEHLTNAPVIVMCHGFTGDCSEHKLFDDFAYVAAACGYYRHYKKDWEACLLAFWHI